MNKTHFRVTGSIIGIIIGGLLGVGILSQTKKSQRSTIAIYSIGAGLIIGFIGGYRIGATLDREAYIEESIGIDKAVTELFKSGNSWIASTKWVDSRNNSFTLLTGKNSNKDLVSELNSELILKHDIQSGSRVNVEKYHTLARNYIFKKLKEDFNL